MTNEDIIQITKEKNCIYILPSRENNNERLYAEDSIVFYKFVKEQNLNIKFIDDNPQYLVLHDETIIIPVICFVLEMLPSVIECIKYFFKDRIGNNKKSRNCRFNAKIKKDNEIKEINYEGPISGFEKIDFNKLLENKNERKDD